MITRWHEHLLIVTLHCSNQVHVPFDELQVEKAPAPKPVAPNEVEAAVAALREEARRKQDQRISRSTHVYPSTVPKLLPPPMLLPTNYSSRMIYGPAPVSPPVVKPTQIHNPSNAEKWRDTRETGVNNSPVRPKAMGSVELVG
jgi:hypothetical protein